MPCPCQNSNEICKNFCNLNSGIKTEIHCDEDDNKYIVITEMTCMQLVPGTSEPHITIQTNVGQFFIPLLTFRGDNIKQTMEGFYWFNEHSSIVNDNTISMEY
jgi:hypothetical protein